MTQEQIDTEVPHAPASAAAVLSDAADPNETCVLPAFDKDFGIPKVDIPTPVSLRDDVQPKKQKAKRKVHPDEDAYHKHKRHIPKPLIVIAVLAAVCGGAYWFVTADPMGVMPGFYDQFGRAAKTTFPSRQKGEATEKESKQEDASEVVQEETVLTDDQLYARLDGLYQTIVSYSDDDQIGEVIDSFNNAICVRRSPPARSCRRALMPCAIRLKRPRMSSITSRFRTTPSMRRTSII